MTEQEYKALEAEGKIEKVEENSPAPAVEAVPLQANLNDYVPLLESLRSGGTSRPYIRVYTTIGTSNPASDITKIQWNNITSSSGAWTLDPSTYEITVPESGFYLIAGCIAYQQIDAANIARAHVYRNGVTIASFRCDLSYAASLQGGMQFTTAHYLDAGDKITTYTSHSGTTDTWAISAGSTSTFLSLAKLS